MQIGNGFQLRPVVSPLPWSASGTPIASEAMVFFQTETTTTTIFSREDPTRPITDWLVDQLGLDRDSLTAGVLGGILEPLLQIIIVVVVALVAIRLLRRLIRRLIARSKERTTGIDFGDDYRPSTRKGQRLDALGAVGYSVVGVVVWLIALLTILGSTFGINISPLLAGAGILGLAIGFGAQDLVKDMLSGVFMLVEDQYGVGDIVDVGEATGVVEGISLRTTRLRDVTGTLWHVPNGEIRRVGNMSQEWSRALLDIGVAYGSDVDQASQVIKGVADEMYEEDTYRGLFLEAPEIWGVEALSADSIVIRLVIKTKPGEQWAISRELRRRIKLALDEAKIEIPFPQRTIWIRQGDGAGTPLATPGEAEPDAPAEHTEVAHEDS